MSFHDTYDSHIFLTCVNVSKITVKQISDEGTTIYDKSIVDFNHILPSVVKLFVGAAKSQGIVFRTEQPFNEASYMYVDRVRIAQVLRSILNKAFKSTGPGGSVLISVTKLSHPDNKRVDYKYRYDFTS